MIQKETIKKVKKILIPIALTLIAAGYYFSSSKDSSKQLENGVIIETIKEGEGDEIKKGDLVSIHYNAFLKEGMKKFDSSIDRGQELKIRLGGGQVVKGLEAGLEGMKSGEKRKITVPSTLGYGTSGAGRIVPPNADLVYEAEVKSVQKAETLPPVKRADSRRIKFSKNAHKHKGHDHSHDHDHDHKKETKKEVKKTEKKVEKKSPAKKVETKKTQSKK